MSGAKHLRASVARAVLRAVVVVAVCLLPARAGAQITVTAPINKHNLSTSGPGPIKSTTMTEVCIFCHTPHNANPIGTEPWTFPQSAMSSGATHHRLRCRISQSAANRSVAKS